MVKLPRNAHLQWTSLPHLYQRDEAIIRCVATDLSLRSSEASREPRVLLEERSVWSNFPGTPTYSSGRPFPTCTREMRLSYAVSQQIDRLAWVPECVVGIRSATCT